MNRIDTIRAHIAANPDTDWAPITGLPGWSAKVDTEGESLFLHVPVVYVDPEYPERGYADDYSDLDEVAVPWDSGVEDDGSGEWWAYDLAAWQ